MQEFLDRYASLSNKNNPIIIYLGKKVSKQIFNQCIDKKKLDKLMDNLKSIENMKLKITYSNDITEYRNDNHSVIKNGNELNYLIYNIIDKHITNQMYIVKYNIQNNEYIIPSFKEYEIIEKYDVMQISLGNVLDIRVCDYQKHYTVSIILKKPNNTNIITNLLEKLVINQD